MHKKHLILLLLLLSLININAQEKTLHEHNVSDKIKNYISANFSGVKHLKYYSEKDSGKTFIEAEFNFSKVEYALKFENDSLIETEISIEYSAIPSDKKTKITKQLDSLFSHYKILECQEVNPSSNPLYEINIKTKTGKYYECYFDKQGALLRKDETILKPISTQF